jgi:hypothetical protein
LLEVAFLPIKVVCKKHDFFEDAPEHHHEFIGSPVVNLLPFLLENTKHSPEVEKVRIEIIIVESCELCYVSGKLLLVEVLIRVPHG